MRKVTNDKEDKFTEIRDFLVENADAIQKLATRHHKKYMGGKKFRTELISKYQHFHVLIVKEIANNLNPENLKVSSEVFNTIGETLGNEAVQDGLTLEETSDGTIFLKQAIWKKLEEDGLFKLSTREYHHLNIIIGTYCDIVASKIAFTFHRQSQYVEKNLQYLAEASKILSSSLDYQKTLNTVAELAVPHIADWCAIDILEDNGKVKQVAIVHKNPKKVKWAKELRKKQPVDPSDSQSGFGKILKTGESIIYPVITEDMLRAMITDPKQLKLALKIGFKSVMMVPIFSKNKPIGAITFVTTETKRYYNEADLLMAEELATRASVAIENAKLFQNSQEAITVRDDFISVASHELKTPVTSVKMFAQVLKKHSEQIGDKQAVRHLSKMDQQIDKLTELIYDLLNVSKIQAGRMEFRESIFNFDEVITDVVDILQETETKHKIVVEGKTGKKVKGDKERIGQVLNNLISNAIKYSPKSDKVVVTLKATKKNVTVAVQDFGIGMSKVHLDKIFERFYRIYDTTDKTFPGLGIGLYIASEIVKRHGGKLWVESDLGKGSTFYFSLPINYGK